MKRIVCLLSAMLALGTAPLAAQSFSGRGPEATRLFPLEPGLTVFELEHRGPERFVVRLLYAQGAVVDEVANATGRFGGSKAVRIPEAGSYLLDVSATGPWSVEVRDPRAAEAGVADPAYQQGVEAGTLAARAASPGNWLLRGFLGGALLGPLGAGVAVAMAGGSDVEPLAALPADAPAQPLFRRGFDTGFEERLRAERRKRAFIGGMVGSAVFTAAVIYMVDVANQGGAATGGGPGGDPGTGLTLIPR